MVEETAPRFLCFSLIEKETDFEVFRHGASNGRQQRKEPTLRSSLPDSKLGVDIT